MEVNRPKLLTRKQAAEFLSRSLATLDHWRGSGSGPPYIRLGANILYDEQDLRAFITAGRVVPGGVRQEQVAVG